MKEYIDIDMAFARHPVTGDVTKKVGVRAVQQSVRNIVMTSLNEWETMPEMGAGVYRMLGENTNPTIQTDVKNKIEDALAQYEPRAEVDKVSVSVSEDYHTLQITIVFYVTNYPDPVTEKIFLKRVN
uniref:Baseplate wedge subunit n=1 Tax=Serratia phage Kevin TaxID=3161161 RepID=A0AAU8KXK8_9CAUD